MKRGLRRGILWGAALVSFVGGHPVAATSASADPQPGFGVLLALIAIVLALLLARRKRRSYLDGGSS